MIYLISILVFLNITFFSFNMSRKTGIDIVMGKTGVGKTTLLALIAKWNLNRGREVWSNVDIKGCKKLSPQDDLMKFLIEGGCVIIDESGRDFNSRNWSKFGNELYDFFTLHRHYKLHLVLSVQFWDRLDIVIRELIHRIYIVEPSIFNRILLRVREVSCSIKIDETTHQISQQFHYVNWLVGGIKYYRRKPAFDMFDTHEVKKLDTKEWEYWSQYDIKRGIVKRILIKQKDIAKQYINKIKIHRQRKLEDEQAKFNYE